MSSISYRDSGVDIDAANEAKHRIRALARSTFNKQVLSEIGSFGAMFKPEYGSAKEPILVASADGVGTKLKVAFQTGIHNTIGYDLVAHCVDDILVQGARPLFFMDYIATGKLDPTVVAAIIEGLARGCKEANCPLIGGETAEMPGFYAEGEYDVAGFIIGWVDRQRIIDGSQIAPDDVLLGLPSLGLHTNGYSLARKLFFEIAGYATDTHLPSLGCTAAEALLKPHRNYLPFLDDLLDTGKIKGLAHLTGGGFLENIPRILPDGCGAHIQRGSWPVLPVFQHLVELGNLPESESYRVFNMGIGMVVAVSPDDAETLSTHIGGKGIEVYRIGQIVAGEKIVTLA
ncbi:MAG: phosphoribosylformylglycinamidine cyclo-ligase [Acidobacteria bacterium]|nr:phosphoribosylformylglycinamidine cyclo-ligase [Acidobacteriota bacterium]